MDNKQIWCVGRWRDGFTDWEICGVFDTEAAAVAICTTTDHFVGSLQLNEAVPEERSAWPAAYYPAVPTPPSEGIVGVSGDSKLFSVPYKIGGWDTDFESIRNVITAAVVRCCGELYCPKPRSVQARLDVLESTLRRAECDFVALLQAMKSCEIPFSDE